MLVFPRVPVLTMFSFFHPCIFVQTIHYHRLNHLFHVSNSQTGSSDQTSSWAPLSDFSQLIMIPWTDPWNHRYLRSLILLHWMHYHFLWSIIPICVCVCVCVYISQVHPLFFILSSTILIQAIIISLNMKNLTDSILNLLCILQKAKE